jgi:hypothetical protein
MVIVFETIVSTGTVGSGETVLPVPVGAIVTGVCDPVVAPLTFPELV